MAIDISRAIAAVAGLGTASYKVVDATKALNRRAWAVKKLGCERKRAIAMRRSAFGADGVVASALFPFVSGGN